MPDVSPNAWFLTIPCCFRDSSIFSKFFWSFLGRLRLLRNAQCLWKKMFSSPTFESEFAWANELRIANRPSFEKLGMWRTHSIADFSTGFDCNKPTSPNQMNGDTIWQISSCRIHVTCASIQKLTLTNYLVSRSRVLLPSSMLRHGRANLDGYVCDGKKTILRKIMSFFDLYKVFRMFGCWIFREFSGGFRNFPRRVGSVSSRVYI